MTRPSAAQLSVMLGMAAGKSLSRDDTDTPAAWYFEGRRLNYGTTRILYCRGWIEARSRFGMTTVYKLSDAGIKAVGDSFSVA